MNFFLTNRNIVTKGGKKLFGNDPGSTVSYVMSPSSAKTLSPNDAVKGNGKAKKWARKIINAAGGDTPDTHIVFYVPGFNTDAEDAFRVHKNFSQSLEAQGLKKAALVTFSWPSEGEILSYLEDDSNARESAIHLVRSGIQVFAKMCEPGCKIRVHVIAHSMGALVVREAFRAAAGRPQTRESAWGISQLILFGADISSRSLKRELSEPMYAKSQRVTNYFNRHDAALATSNAKRFLSSPRLGRHGAPTSVLDKVVDVDVSKRWKTVAATNELGLLGDKFESHTFYRKDPVFAKDVVETLKGDADRRNIADRKPHTEDGRLFIT